MGIISWIKDKCIGHKFQNANRLLSEGKADSAIEILQDILDNHPDALSALLEIYHSQIIQGNQRRISDVALLFGNHQFIKADCVNFVEEIEGSNQIWLLIDYCQALYCKGIRELKNKFIKYSTKLVVETNYVSNLQTLTIDNSLLISLSEFLLEEAKVIYNQHNDLVESERLCLLIQPYLSSQYFYELYANIRFDLIALKGITEESVKQLDSLFKDVKTNYHLADSAIRVLTDKGLKLAKDLFCKKEYVAALLVSQRLIEKYSDARQIYANSALKLYVSSDCQDNIIVTEHLYKCLGSDNSALVGALEPYIPYSTHRQKYISVVESELSRLMTKEKSQAENLFERAWELTRDERIIRVVLSSGSDESKVYFASLILNSDKDIIANNSNLKAYVSELSKLNNVEFVVTTLETLLGKGKKVATDYEKQILRFANDANTKSRRRIEIVERGLAKIQTDRLYSIDAIYLNEYIESGRYDSAFASKSATSLIGHNNLAEILIAKIFIDEARKSQDCFIREDKLRKALAINRSHNQLFDHTAYNSLMPIIENLITDLSKELYATDRPRATELLYLLRDNNLSWFDTYASLYLESIKNEQESEEFASKVLDIIIEGVGITSSENDRLWTKYITIKLSIISKKDVDKAISELTNLLIELDSQCVSTNKTDLKKEISSALCKRLFSRAKVYEKTKVYNKAIEDYERILDVSGNYIDVKTRIYICKLKNGKHLVKADRDEIDNLLSTKKDKAYQRDLAYRWCLYLISRGLLEKAEVINTRILDPDTEITQVCKEERIKAQQNLLDGLNEGIVKLNNSELTPEEAIAFGQSLSRTLNDINLIVQVSTQKRNILKEAIRLYAIEKFYAKGEYLQSLNGMKVQDSTYLSEPIALRNIAIMSLSAAENGQLTMSNYKELLAIWATAIYQQRIFVDSLDYTSWDDPYTFTLESALGWLDDNDNEELPDNVNFDDSSDSGVVSILEVQKTLLSRMEAAIKENSEYQQFLSLQLEAMDKLAEQKLDENCVIVAPYLLTMSNAYKDNVSKALTAEANQHYGNWESILEIGNLYGLNNGDFGKYASALEVLNVAVASIERKRGINTLFTQTHISLVKEFDILNTNLISAVTTAMNNDIAQNVEYRKLNSDYGVVVKVIGDDTLSFTFSNYINQQVVRILNDKTQTLAQSAPILFEIYSFCKCNPHLKRNIENILEALIHNYISDGDDENLTVLDNLLSSTREFDSQIVKALKGGGDTPEEMMALFFSSNEVRFNQLKTRIGSKSRPIHVQFNAIATKIVTIKVQLELSQIVDKVNNGTMSKCDALQKVYNIYKNNKNIDRVCENLATLIPMCVVEYIISDKYGKSKVESVLNSLKSNMSPTFRAHNSGIGEAYNMVWGQLPFNARNAIENNPWTLNAQGEALKKGLDYLKALR